MNKDKGKIGIGEVFGISFIVVLAINLAQINSGADDGTEICGPLAAFWILGLAYTAMKQHLRGE